VSVVLPVYNGAAYVLEAVDSILAQTWRDFELIVLDDGSTDETPALLAQRNDPRLMVVRHLNRGLALTLNRGIELARGEYIARQDADDISEPKRLERQVEWMDAHPACGLLGTWSTILDADGRRERQHRHPCRNGELQMRLLFDSFFVHSSVMLRRSVLDVVGPYPTDPERNPPEDFDLWLRIARRFEIANLPEPLVVYREVPGSISRVKMDLLNRRAIAMAAENLEAVAPGSGTAQDRRNLVALLRFTPDHAVRPFRWQAMEDLLVQARAAMTERWPQDAQDIGLGHAHLRGVLRSHRWRTSAAGRASMRARNWLRRVASGWRAS
jgi:glycosyltransferase involved in cell wall biosynthesis